MKDSEVMEKALTVLGLEGEHWGKLGNPELGKPPFKQYHCAFTAIAKVVDTWFGKDLADSWAQKLGFKTSGELFAWNDAPERTFAEVKELFEKQIAFAKVVERDQGVVAPPV